MKRVAEGTHYSLKAGNEKQRTRINSALPLRRSGPGRKSPPPEHSESKNKNSLPELRRIDGRRNRNCPQGMSSFEDGKKEYRMKGATIVPVSEMKTGKDEERRCEIYTDGASMGETTTVMDFLKQVSLALLTKRFPIAITGRTIMRTALRLSNEIVAGKNNCVGPGETILKKKI